MPRCSSSSSVHSIPTVLPGLQRPDHDRGRPWPALADLLGRPGAGRHPRPDDPRDPAARSKARRRSWGGRRRLTCRRDARDRLVRYPRTHGDRAPARRPRARRDRLQARHRRRHAAPRDAVDADRSRERALPRRGRPRDQRRRVRPAVPRAGRAGDRLSGADHRRLADAARRRDTDRRNVRRGPPRAADAVAVERVQPRRAARVRRARAQGSRPSRCARARPGPALRRRAQDRRPRDQPPLRARPLRPGRDPR